MQARRIEKLALPFFALFGVSLLITGGQAQKSGGAFTQTIPKTLDDEAIASLEVPLANPLGSPKHVSADYYYRIPVAPIYKSYPVYAPGHEPPGYIDWLKQGQPALPGSDSRLDRRERPAVPRPHRASAPPLDGGPHALRGDESWDR